MLSQMLSIQNTVNSNVDQEWTIKNREWYRAAWVECGELISSLDYKWWKHQEVDLENVRIELVDIWHFILSSCIEGIVSAEVVKEHWLIPSSKGDTLELIDILTLNLLKLKYERGSILSVIEIFSKVCNSVSIDLETIYLFYIGKATLNNFRQNNGYKEGTYSKYWRSNYIDGAEFSVEDNEFLTIILKDYMNNKELPDNLQSIVYNRLNELYSKRNKV